MSYTTPQTTGPAAQGYANDPQQHDPAQPQAAPAAPPQYGSAAGAYNNEKAQYPTQTQAQSPGVAHQDPNQNPDLAQQPQAQVQQVRQWNEYPSLTLF